MRPPAARPTPTACLFDEDDELGIDKLTAILDVRYPEARWMALEADGQPFALISQDEASPGGALAMTVQRMANGAGWEVVRDGVALATQAQTAGRAALEAGIEVAYQCLIGAA